MNNNKTSRCVIYTRKSSEEGLEQEFNSLHAQREACAAYITSQKHEGWSLSPTLYDDGGYSGGNLNRPALKQLLEDIQQYKNNDQKRIDIIIVYKVDRLTRCLTDFAKLVEVMDQHQVSFVSITQQFNTTTSMGRLTLNVLLSFAQFEREVTGERIRDKIALSKQKGKWMGGLPPIGYDCKDQKLVINQSEAQTIQDIFQTYTELKSVNLLKLDIDHKGYCSKQRMDKHGKVTGGLPFTKGHLYRILQNRIYIGEIPHKDKSYPGQHEPIITPQQFNQVQQLLAENRIQKVNGTHSKDPSLLAGKLFDDNHHYMTPKHSRTRKRHYRYYTSQAIIQGKPQQAGTLPNIPAGEIENYVKQTTLNFLKDTQQLQPYLNDLCIAEQSKLIRIANQLDDTNQENKQNQINIQNNKNNLNQIIRSIIAYIVISDKEMKITLCQNTMIKTLQAIEQNQTIIQEAERETNTPVIIIKQIQLTATNNGSKIIAGQLTQNINPQLIKAIARSFLWHEQLLTQQVKNQKEIAKQENINSTTYISRILKLRFLAPDIIESILKGNHALDWTVEKLTNINDLNWQVQRQLLNIN